ncbi:antigen peptide transporter 2-like [Callorhinchus milii]|nr:antigen peptide transporter 2-like [Callorhinchus milii]
MTCGRMAVSWCGWLLPVSACDLVLGALLQRSAWFLSLGWGSLLGCWLGGLLRLALLSSLVLSLDLVSSSGGRGRGWQRLLFVVCVCLLVPLYGSVRLLLSDTQALISIPGCWALLHALSAFAVIAGETLFPTDLEQLHPERPSAPGQTRDKDTAKATLGRLLSYSRPDAIPLSGAFIFLTLAVIGEMFGPYYTGRVIDVLSAHYDQQIFMTAISCMFLTSIGSSIAAGLRGGLFTLASSRFVKRLRGQLFGSIVHQEIAFFESTRTGDITSRLSMDTTLMSDSITLNINILLRSLVKTIGILSFMFSLSWQLTLLTLIEIPLTTIIQKLYSQYHQKLLTQVQDSIAYSSELAAETVSGIRTVRSFAMEDEEFGLYQDRLMDTQKLKNKRDLIRAVYLLCLKVCSWVEYQCHTQGAEVY